MKLTLHRKTYNATATLGELFVDGVFQCYTLEDVVRPAGEAKVYGKTAIPAGTYNVVINQSNRFKRLLPLLVAVPDFEGVRIHPGNTSADTEGCILPGKSITGPDFVSQSRVAFNELFDKMSAHKGDIEITIQND